MNTQIAWLGLLLAGLGAPGFGAGAASFLTTTFGNGERCEHRGTLRVDGASLRFDLAALPAETRIARAVLRVPAQGHRTGESVRVVPIGLDGTEALALRPPLYDRFDATAAVREWVRRPESNQGLAIERSGGVDFRQAQLEVSYWGAAGRTIPAVTGLQARHQSGQTFLTWREIEDVVGRDDPTFEDYERQILEARARREVVYRVYRHDRLLTLETLGEAELVREVAEALSGWNLKALRNTEHPNQGAPTMRSPLRPGYNLVRADVVPRYRIGPEAEPLPRATGLAVLTALTPGRWHYAVTASIDGAEAVSRLEDGATLREPVEEQPAPFPAMIYQRTRAPEGTQRQAPAVDVFNAWLEPPQHNLPTVSEAFVVRWPDLPPGDAQRRLGLWLNTGTYGGTATEMGNPGWHAARHYLKGVFTLGLTEGDLWQGFHECVGTLRGYDQGFVHNYPQRRVLAAAAWASAHEGFFIDPERIYIWGQLAGWALRHGDVFAVVMSNGYGNPAIGKLAQQHGWKWGPYPKGATNWLGLDPWTYMNLAKWIRNNPAVELPYWLCAPAYGAYPAHTIGDFGFMPWPEMLHAMVSTRRAFAATWSSNGPGPTAPLHELVPRLQRRQSLPAFTRCSLDQSPGDGDHADSEKGGGINLHQRWEPETIVDEPGRWEMTVHLASNSPAPQATMDLTPRRCQRFQPRPGDTFEWSNSLVESGQTLQSGRASADRWGLVTIEGLTLTQARHRIQIAPP